MTRISGHPPQKERPLDEAERVGLCFACRHSRRVPTPRATYWLCERSATDSRFVRYPRLPMEECAGYEPQEPGGAQASE